MSVKIYDSTIGSFKDAETPLIWDEQAQAWKDSVGLVWNESAQAWEERWSAIKSTLYLYNEGDECTNVTGGWEATVSGRTGGIVTKSGESIKITSNSGYNEMMIVTQKTVDLSKYTKIGFVLSDLAASQTYTNTAGYINFSSNRTQYVYVSEFAISSDKSVSVGNEIYIDLTSSLVGKSLYIGMNACANRGSITVKKLWLE